MSTNFERINSHGCEFKVYRKRRSDKVISIAIWKKSPGYTLNLSTSIFWWLENAHILFPHWNIRFYIDNSLIKRVLKNDVDWDQIISRMKKHDNIEVWQSYCPWGKDEKDLKCYNCHINTFNSLLRFHSCTDPSVEISVIKNLELLSSVKDSKIIHDWVHNTHKKYYFLFDPTYTCKYSNPQLCKDLGLKDNIMILATFGTRNGIGIDNYFYEVRQLIRSNKTLQKYVYGVDELVLTKLIKPLMTEDNTYTILRDYFAQWLPLANPNYNFFMTSFIKCLTRVMDEISHKDKEHLSLIFNDTDFKYDFDITEQYERVQAGAKIRNVISKMEKNFPDILVKILKYIHNDVIESISYTDYEILFQQNFDQMQKICFNIFKNNLNIKQKQDDEEDEEDEEDEKYEKDEKDNLIDSFFLTPKNEYHAKILFILGLRTIIFDFIDWIGMCVKTKEGMQYSREEDIIKESDINQMIENRKNSRSRLIRGDTNEKEREIVRKLLQRKMQKEVKEHNDNIKIFKRNLYLKLLDKSEYSYV